ncbi:MAG: HAD hydrolase family protein, partial [Chloroflexi bacterium]|nr:HAD hydrolase family protein [Chloroflexota bacterium]
IDLELYSATHYFAERETWSTKAHREYFDMEPTIIDFSQVRGERIIKGGLVVTNPEERAGAQSFHRRFDGSLYLSWARTPAYPGVAFINILSPEVSKGKALEALVSYLGVGMNEVMAVGDGTNDISLLRTAGLAVAMGNAPDEVKAVADYLTLDVEQSGLAAAIREFLGWG